MNQKLATGIPFRSEVDRELHRIRARAKVKVDEVLAGRSKEYCDAFWKGFDTARELGHRELDWLLGIGETKNDEAKSAG